MESENEKSAFIQGITIDQSKSYKTFDGRKVVIALIERDRVHGLFKMNPPAGLTPEQAKDFSAWEPFLWNAETGMPYYKGTAVFNRDTRLVESVPTKQLSIKLHVSEAGFVYLESNIAKNTKMFGAFTVNLELEKGSFEKVYNLNDL